MVERKFTKSVLILAMVTSAAFAGDLRENDFRTAKFDRMEIPIPAGLYETIDLEDQDPLSIAEFNRSGNTASISVMGIPLVDHPAEDILKRVCDLIRKRGLNDIAVQEQTMLADRQVRSGSAAGVVNGTEMRGMVIVSTGAKAYYAFVFVTNKRLFQEVRTEVQGMVRDIREY